VALGWAARRDIGAGLVPARPGPAVAGPWLRSPLALAWRVQRGAVLGWVVGFTLLGAVLGAALGSIGGLFDTPAYRDLAAALGGGSVAEVFFRLVLYVLAQIVTAAAVAAALQVRSQETAGLADLLLSGPIDRLRWALGHLVVTAAGTGLVLAGLGLGAGLGYGRPLAVLGMTLAYLPACLLFAGLAVALTGWVPRLASPVTWTVLALAIAVDLLGEFRVVDIAVLQRISPFAATSVPLSTGSGLAAVLLVLVLLVVALAGVGLLGLRRRDMDAA
jgi:ABC-2 type transport system permease protein